MLFRTMLLLSAAIFLSAIGTEAQPGDEKSEQTTTEKEDSPKEEDGFRERFMKAKDKEGTTTQPTNGAAKMMSGIFFLLVIGGILAYFFPAFVAMMRHHPNSTAIFLLNLFLGWTFIGWVISLVWSVTAIRERTA